MPRKVSESALVAYFGTDHPAVDEPGFYVLEGTPAKDDQGEHHTNLEPGRRVYPHPDGDGWTYDPTELVDGEVRLVSEVDEEGGDK